MNALTGYGLGLLLGGMLGMVALALVESCAAPAWTTRPYNNIGTAMAAMEEMAQASEACGRARKTFHSTLAQDHIQWYCE